MKPLARDSYHPPAADADSFAVTDGTLSGRFDVVSAAPSASFRPCGSSRLRLDVLTTNGGKSRGLAHHSGFSLITAIFLIVVVASLGVFMVTISSVQQQTSTLSILSSRVLFAADSGMQWAMRRATRDAAAGLNCPAAPATGQVNFAINNGAISGYTVTITCSVQSFTENPDTFDVYNLTSRASRGTLGSPDYHSRTIRANITTAP